MSAGTSPEFIKAMWRGYMMTQNRAQSDAWYERLTREERRILVETPMALTIYARKGQNEMTTYEQYEAGYITREQWAEKEIAPMVRKAEEASKVRWYDRVIAWTLGALIVTEIVRAILW